MRLWPRSRLAAQQVPSTEGDLRRQAEEQANQIERLTQELILAKTLATSLEGELSLLQEDRSKKQIQHLELESLYRKQCATADRDLHQVSGQLIAAMSEAEDGVGILINTFSDLAKTSRNLVGQTQNALSTGENSVNVSAAAATETMDHFVEQMLHTADAVEETASEMENLVRVTSQLSGLLKEIEAIASQTGLLALNASLEAARAGDAGLGFSVVAAQVRNLAERARHTSEQTRNLTASISTSSASVSQRLGDTATTSRRAGLTAQDELGTLMSQIQAADARNREAVVGISAQAAQIDREVSQAIVAFQFHDMMRQRLEHALAPLNQLREALMGNCPDSQLSNAVGAAPDLHVVHYNASDDADVTLF